VNAKRIIAVWIVLATAVCMARGQGAETDYDQAAFDAAMVAAGRAPGRVERVENLKRALAIRPNHPGNIVLEYRIGVALSQHGDPASGTGPNPREAIPWFEGILKHYKQETYHENIPPGGSWDAQLLIPKAAVHLASIHVLTGKSDPQAMRDILLTGLDAADYTYQKRKEAWANQPPPPSPEEVKNHPDRHFMLLHEDRGGKIAMQYENWQRRQEAVAKGEILNDTEMLAVRSAVSHYGYAGGPQKPWEVEPAMRELIERYPNTQIAQVAQRHIEQAAEMTRKLAGEIIARGTDLDAVVQSPPVAVDATAQADAGPAETTVESSQAPASGRDGADVGGEEAAEPSVAMDWVIGAAAVLALAVIVIVWVRARQPRASR
jgi:hypothetical protein